MYAQIKIDDNIFLAPINSEGAFEDACYHMIDKYGISVHNEFECIVFDAIADGMTTESLIGTTQDGHEYIIDLVTDKQSKRSIEVITSKGVVNDCSGFWVWLDSSDKVYKVRSILSDTPKSETWSEGVFNTKKEALARANYQNSL